MLCLNRLNDINYLQAKEKALILARRQATRPQQQVINILLSIIYNAKYKLLSNN